MCDKSILHDYCRLFSLGKDLQLALLFVVTVSIFLQLYRRKQYTERITYRSRCCRVGRMGRENGKERCMRGLVFLLALVVIGVSQPLALELVTNGAYEQVLSNGWQENINGTGGSIIRGTAWDPDPDYEVRVYRGTGIGSAELTQIVDIPMLDVDINCNAKIYATATSTAWAAAAVSVNYLDQDGFTLGSTRIYHGSPYCPWTDDATTHLIPGTPNQWAPYTINVAEELGHLPGVIAERVKKVQIVLGVFTADC